MKRNIFWGLVLAGGIVASCADNDDPFAGSDNYITRFSLQQDGKTIYASFRGDTIDLLIPADITLSNPTANVVISENSTLRPDPSTITNWEEQTFFVVTSYTGVAHKYLYYPTKQECSVKGVIILNTQADVEAFGAENHTRLDGSLIIGRSTGTDSIASLAPLASLRYITGNVTLNPTYKGDTFEGLDGLETIGGSLAVNGVKFLWTVEMNKMTSIGGGLTVSGISVNKISFPRLQEIGGNVALTSGFVTAEFPLLKSISGGLQLKSTVVADRIAFGQLRTVEGLLDYDMKGKSFECPELTSVGSLNVIKSTLALLYMPKLQDVGTTFVLYDNPLYEASFPALTHAGSITVSCPSVGKSDFGKLQTVDGDLSIGLGYFNIEELKSLQSIGGTLTLSSPTDKVKLPTGLKSIRTLIISSTGIIKEVDVKGLAIGELRLGGATLGNTTIIGDEVFDGTVNLQNLSGQFPKLQGFSQVNKLNIEYLNQSGGTIEIGSIKKITGDFRMRTNSNPNELLLPDLEEVGGNFGLYSNIKQSHFPKLKTIGGNAVITIFAYDANTFPQLTSIGGDWALHTGYSSGNIPVLQYPSLKTVGGVITLYGMGLTNNDTPFSPSSYKNTTLTNLNFLSTLERAGGFSVQYHTNLSDYEGLKKAIKTFAADKWTVANNAYNPTYDELATEEKWKP